MSPRTITAEEARALREAATPGPWAHGNKRIAHVYGPDCIVHRIDLDTDWRATPMCRPRWIADAALIAAAPDLAATVVVLRALLDEAYDIIAGQANPAWYGWCDRAMKADDRGGE